MIIKWFLLHQMRETLRSSFWQKQLVLNIFMGLFLLLMLAYLVMLGLFIDKILESLAPEADPVQLFNRYVLYYFGFEFIIRFLAQSLPVLNLEPYLLLPVRKTAIVHYVAAKSLMSIWNYLPWLVFIPFAFKMIAPAYSAGSAWNWIVAMILMVFTNNFVATYTKRQLAHKPRIVILVLLVILSLIALDHFHLVSLSSLSALLMNGLLTKPILLVIPLSALVVAYLINYYFLRGRLYPDEVNIRKTSRTEAGRDIPYLKSMGLTGHMIYLDIRLILRNKRTKTTIYLLPFFVLYGLIFYYRDQPMEMDTAFPIFIGIFMTGGLMISYLNFCFTYESGHFDGILAKYSDFSQYIRAKYLLAVGFTVLCYVLTLPYAFLGWEVLLVNTVSFLYNIGFLAYAMIWISTYSRSSIDLSRSSTFNYQGMGVSQWITMIPGFLLPVLIFWVFRHLGVYIWGDIVIGLIGLIGLVLNKSLLNLVTVQFMKNRYAMAKGFRE